jgi:hypothetical protein
VGTGITRAVELAEFLTTELAGVARVVVDPAELSVPGVLVIPPTRTYDLACGYTAEWSFIVLTTAPVTMSSLTLLDELVDALVEAIGEDVLTATPGQYPLPGYTDPLPCYTIRAQEALA